MNIKVIGHGSLLTKAFSTSFLVDNILINAPSGVLSELKKMNSDIDDISVIVITHLHAEQLYDLPVIIAHEQARKREKPLVIIGPRDLKKQINKMLKSSFGASLINDLKINFIDAETVYNANVTGEYIFTFINIKHSQLKKAHGLILSKGDSSISFALNATFCPGVSYMLKQTKNCVITIGSDKTKKELDLESFKKIANEYSNTFFPVGYSDEILSELKSIKNAKLIMEGEQFYI